MSIMLYAISPDKRSVSTKLNFLLSSPSNKLDHVLSTMSNSMYLYINARNMLETSYWWLLQS